MDEPNPLEWLTINEGSAITPYTPVTVRYLAREGLVKACKRGRDWFLEKDSLLTYAREMQALGTSKHDPTRHK